MISSSANCYSSQPTDSICESKNVYLIWLCLDAALFDTNHTK